MNTKAPSKSAFPFRLSAIALLCLFCLTATSAQAAIASGSGEHTGYTAKDHSFTLDKKTKLKLTVACKKIGGNGSMDILFYTPSPGGGWRQVHDLRVLLRKDTKKTSDTFSLPAGKYKFRVVLKRVEYMYRLERD